ncbi:outer membrane autotransporter barrel protein [Rickettsiales bacterium Ac37b]|nr:outer membrane autotransporter barrel protein [Rickettsiales bacterium Ac37b]
MTFLNQFGQSGAGKNQFSAPQAMRLTNHGTIYVADSANRRIVVLFDPNSWTAPGTAVLGTLPLNQNLTLLSGYHLQIQPINDITSGTPLTSDGKLSVIDGATLTANNGSSITASSMEIDNTSTFYLRSSATFTIAGNITSNGTLRILGPRAINNNILGTGTIIKEGIESLNFIGITVNAANLNIQQGRVNLSNSATLNSPVTMATGTTLGFLGANTLNTDVTGTGQISKTNPGELAFDSNSVTANTVNIQQGSFKLNNATVNANITLGNNVPLTIQGNNSITGNISSVGNIVTTGLGEVLFNNSAITTPALDIQQGTIVLNNSNINAPVTVGNSAKLKGTGAILSNLINNGIVAPGASPGIITVTGNYTTAPGASLESYIAPSASPVAGIDYSQLLVNGTADITANNLVVNAAIGSYTNGAEYQLLTADNGINGEFANYTLNITGPYEAPITYTPNQVLLTIVKKDIPHIPDIPPSLTIKHANSLVDYINSLTNMSPDFIKILDVLDKLPIDERDNAVKSMSPNRNLTANYVNQDMNQLIQGITSARLDIISSHDTNFNAHSNLMATDHNKKDLLSSTKASLINNISSNLNNNWLNSEKHAVWASPFAQFIRQDTSKKGRGYKAKIGGMIIGYDQKLSSSVIGGISLGYYQAMFDHNSHGGNDNKIKGTFATIYGSKTINNSYLNGSLLTAYNNHHLNRQINIPTLATAYATSKHRSYEVSPRVELGYNIKTDCNYQITPFAATEYSIIFENGYTEKGANALDMRVKSGQNHLFTNELGIKLRKAIKLSSEEELNIKGKLSYINKTRSKKHNKIKSGFKEQTASYSSNNYSKAEHQISPSVEIELNKKNGVSVGGRYSGEFSKSFQAHEALFNLGMQF